jgi:hypothetical protein
VLPLHYAPIARLRRGFGISKLLGFLVLGVLPAPVAELFNVQPVRSQFFVLMGMIVHVVANRAFQTNKVIL